jgi:signal transduction histidine kinase/CheY-like chemotaxis protein
VLDSGAVPSAETYFFGTGVCAEVARSVDWTRTPLGSPDSWSTSLRTTLATIFHSRHPMFLWWGPELIQFYNDAYLPSFGVGKHPVAMGQPGRECWPEIWPLIGPQIEDVMRGGVPSWNEDQLVPILRNGRLEEVYWTYGYSPVFDDGGSVAGTLVVCTETTARVVAERRLKLLRALGDALLATREPADTTRLAAAQLGADPYDIAFAIAVSGSEPPLLVGVDEAAAAGVQAVVGKVVVTARTFALPAPVAAQPWPEPVSAVHAVPIEGSGHLVFGVSARLPFDDRYALFFAQIARQIEATQARVRVEYERRNLLEHAPLPAAFLTGPAHVFDIANGPFCAMVGRDVRGKPYSEAFPELRQFPLSEILANVYRSGEPFVTNEMRVPLRGESGEIEERFFKFSLSAIRGSDGHVSGIMAIGIEITEQVTARRALQAAAQAKDEFLATISHELRTPLNAMLGWAKILQNDSRDPVKLQKGLDVLERNAGAQARLVGDLLDVSRIISGKLTLALSAVDVAGAVAAALDVVRPSADAKRVRLETAIAADVGLTLADPDRVQQILWNLLSNAIRFTPSDGRVQVTVAREHSRLHIEIADTGAGIGAEHLANIFERFRQVDATTTRQHGGLGLGLAIVRYLVEAHGGSVSARSEGVGKGSTFDVLLPIRAVAFAPPVESDARVPPSSAPAEQPPSELHRVRILAVDDDRDSLDLLRELLESAGGVVTSANSVEQALAQRGPFDIVISDIGMPVMDGYDLIRALRARPREAGGSVPAIALTAYARTEDAARAREAGFQEHLTKPVDMSALLRAIKRWVGSRE